MEAKYAKQIAKEFSLGIQQVENTLILLQGGATVPFISRYRKEMTNNLDEVQVTDIKNRQKKLEELDQRRQAILDSIESQELLTDELSKKIEAAQTLSELEDLYLPFKPKRKTRATIAKAKGLEPLAKLIMTQNQPDTDALATRFLTNEVETTDDALQGARDIIAEWVNENTVARNAVRQVFDKEAVISSHIVKGKEADGVKYQDYYDWSEPLKKCPSHRLMAMKRGEAEGFLRIHIQPSEENALQKLNRIFVRANNAAAQQVEMAVKDSYKRLLMPSIETEYGNLSKEKADHEAINVFAKNLRQLLLAAPLGEKRILAIDPGFRTGCKVVCLDENGNLLHNETIYPHPPQNEVALAKKKIATLVNQYKIDAIAIGNGTASRETETFIRYVKFDSDINVFVVSENGASIYSASPVAREEFPDYDVTVRGAVSIGRRLMDPLAELVKIDPKSIGVGQYQHDVDQKALQHSLDDVVESCVNLVGVDLNTASKHILTYVSGLNSTVAKNIVEYRKENGAFKTRNQLKKVPRLGEKAYEQAAGFLRIRGAKNPLDNSAVHPESYYVVEKMAADLGVKIDDLIKDETIRKQIDIKKYIDQKVGEPTLKDILKELAKPGRDPRQQAKVFEFSQDVRKIDDLKEGMILPGIVTNITNFGAFVDVGVKQDGLVHISQMADKYIANPSEVVSLHQHVQVKVVSVDVPRKRIQLAMKDVRQ